MTYTYNEAFEASKNILRAMNSLREYGQLSMLLKILKATILSLLPTICTAELLVRLLVLRENIKTQWMSNCCST